MNMTLKQKLFSLVALAITGFVVLGVISYRTVTTVGIGSDLDNQMQAQDDLRSDFREPDLNILKTRVLMYQIQGAKDRATVERLAGLVQQERRHYEDALANIGPRITNPRLKDLVMNQAGPAIVGYFDFAQKEVIPAFLEGNKAKGDALIPTLRGKYEASEPTMVEILRLIDAEDDVLMSGAARDVKSETRLMVLVAVAVTILVCLVGMLLTKSISASMAGMSGMIQEIAANNLAIEDLEVTSDDEMGQAGEALNRMKNNLREIIQAIAGTAEHVASASEEISSSASQQSQSAETQKDQTTQVATALQEMSATVLQVSENSGKAADASSKAAETARHGGTIVDQTLAKMRTIAESVSNTAKKVGELGKSSDQIGRIIGVIDDIADQTNLLALNAAIEAARAGEQGRGFAVVADEVRKLAERTTSATKEIAQMIRTVQEETKVAVAAMEAGTRQVEEGVQTTAQAGDSLKEIIHTSEQVGEMITHIATAATEQSSTTEEINNNMEQIATLVKESADGAQQSAKACQDLSGLALDLQKMVGNFKLQGSGDGSGRSARLGGNSAGYVLHRKNSSAKALAAGSSG